MAHEELEILQNKVVLIIFPISKIIIIKKDHDTQVVLFIFNLIIISII